MNLLNHDKESNCTFTIKHDQIQSQFINKVIINALLQIVILIMIIKLCFSIHVISEIAIYLNPYCIFFSLILIVLISLSRVLPYQIPFNYLLLAFYTLSKSVYVFNAIQEFSSDDLLTGRVLTIFILCLLILFSLSNYNDLTASFFNINFFFVQLFIGSILIFSEQENISFVTISGLIFAGHLIIDLQLISGIKEARFAVDDYVIAAIMLFTDVVHMHLFILELLKYG